MPLRLPPRRTHPSTDLATLRPAADQAFSRTAGAPLVAGNAVRVLRDAAENYPAWEEAIASARRTIHIEMYIFHRDPVGRRFVELLTSRAKAGVEVRVIYDWFGSGTGPMFGLFTPLLRAGGKVRAFNPPSLANALGWLRRNHRKLITVDSRVAFVSGLCIGQDWVGRPERNREPWRDTGLEILGPAVANAEASFAESWALAGGGPIDLPTGPDVAAGDVNLRLIPTEPFTGNMVRVDLLVTAVARKSLWLTDAYFIGTGSYIEALARAARDGVDVRLLLPRDSDVGWTVPVARALYRPLLEAGVRVYEWSGTMVHAKTAVADARWARVGSTNLNLNSWIGNWEMDVAIEDAGVAQTLADHFEEDLERSVEVVLKGSSRDDVGHRAPRSRGTRASRRVARTVTGVGHSIGAAVTGNRPLENYELSPVLAVAVALAIVAGVGFFAPRLLAWPVALIALWMAISFMADAWTVWRRRE